MSEESLSSTQYLTSGQVSFTGLGSGTDFESIIEKTIEVESYRIKRLEAWKSQWDAKVVGFQALNTNMLSLKTTLEGMNTPDEFLIKTSSSSDSTVLTATADSSAQVVPHTVIINQLAQNEIFIGQHAFADTSAVINNSGGDALFDYTYAGESVSVTVPDGTTLAGLINMINNDPDNPGVKAGYVKVSDSDYRLQIWGMDLGTDNQFSVDGSTTLSNASAADFAETQNAQNCQLRIDGFPSAAGGYIERATNTVSDAITGLTLSLKDTGTVNIATNVDNEAIKESVRTFVGQVNELRTLIINLTDFNDTTQEGSLLTGNYGVQIISTKLKSLTATKGIGFDYDEDTFTSLGILGITTDADAGSATLGLLEFDEELFDDALEYDPDGVAAIFSAYYAGTSDSTSLSYQSHIQGTTEAGEYEVAYTMDGAGNITAATINGHTASIDNGTKEITGAAGNPEAGLAIKVQDLTAGDHTGTVRIKLGKAAEMVESLKDLTSSTDGPLKILEDNYQDIMDSIDEKIDYEERRLERMERDLRNKYARLEALLGQYDNLQSSMNSQIAQLED